MADHIRQKLQDSEESFTNMSFWAFYPLFSAIRSGDIRPLEKELPVQIDGFPEGRISKDRRRQLEYLAVSSVNSFMIAAIQGGVYPPDANAAADGSLRRIAGIRSVTELPQIISDSAFEMCGLVRKTKLQDTGNVHVEKAKQYISSHITQEITIEDIASAVNLSTYHLCRLFRAHTGCTMREYLIAERIEAAKRLLAGREYTIPGIAALLRFCDQSYFTKVFHQKTGMTPKQYRDQGIL